MVTSLGGPATGWIVASALLDRPVAGQDPYPCLCEHTRESAPDFVTDPKCWWTSKRTGRLESRCPCWGAAPEDWKPADCCSNHPKNPRYRVDLRNAGASLLGVTSEDVQQGLSEAPGATDPPFAPDPSDLGGFGDENMLPGRGEHLFGGPPPPLSPPLLPPYVRRWSHAEVHCPCPTPWDHVKVGGGKTGKSAAGVGVHCTNCHQNFRNTQVASVHQRWVTDPCKRAEDVRDVDTGAPLLRAGVAGGMVVWG